jgi:7,8-dihydropterin-6-yl-methyl-4-(beta-D-ribofuranosyl)aminobenzene 5'-phosphate synthase
MKIAILSNNYSTSTMPTEWGLSIYVEYNGKKILIDAGLGSTFLVNAQQMGIDANKVDFIILTHCHNDHTGGLEHFEFNGQKVYAHKDVFKERFSLHGSNYKPKGVPWRKEDLKGEVEFIHNETFTELGKGIYLSGSIPRVYGTPENRFFERVGDVFMPDIIEDEQLVIFELPCGELVVFSGCTHFGVQNMTEFIRDRFPNKKVKALFAGLHIIGLSKDQQETLIDYLGKCGIYKKVYSLHCTGEEAGKLIEKKIKGKLVSVGDIYEI